MAAAQAPTLVGDFAGNSQGQFVSWSVDGDKLRVTDTLGTLEIRGPFSQPEFQNGWADFGALRLHDNAYSWIHVREPIAVRTDQVSESGHALHFDRWDAFGVEMSWRHNAGWLHLNATDLLIARSTEFADQGATPSAWGLLEADAMTWFAFEGAPFETRHLNPLTMRFVGNLGVGAPAAGIRIEQAGHFDGPRDRYVLMLGTNVAQQATLEALTQAAGPFSFNVTGIGPHHVLHIHVPPGLSGDATLQLDLDAPMLQAVTHQNLSPYAPAMQLPTLNASWNEPVWATLRIGEQEKVATHAAPEVRFRLTGLQPQQTYNYTLVARDLAGNAMTTIGTLETGPGPATAGHIEISQATQTQRGTHVQFFASSNGRSAQQSELKVFIDKQPRDDLLFAWDAGFLVTVPPDAKELRIELTTPTGRVSETMQFESTDTEAPLGLLVPASALTAVALWRRR